MGAQYTSVIRTRNFFKCLPLGRAYNKLDYLRNMSAKMGVAHPPSPPSSYSEKSFSKTIIMYCTFWVTPILTAFSLRKDGGGSQSLGDMSSKKSRIFFNALLPFYHLKVYFYLKGYLNFYVWYLFWNLYQVRFKHSRKENIKSNWRFKRTHACNFSHLFTI